MGEIGIIGAGIAGLHLALFLQQHGISTRLYAKRTPDQQRAARLPNTAAHFGPTHARERALGVNHWDTPDRSATELQVVLGGPHPLSFCGRMDEPIRVVDQRLYLARLLEDYLERGGDVQIGAVGAGDVERLAAQHDLLVISTGRGGLADLFPVVPEASPFTQPARQICTGFYRGVAFRDGTNVTISLAPGVGELFEMAMISFDGVQHVMLFEGVPGGPLAMLATLNYAADPAAFNATVLELLRDHFPATYARASPAEFGVTGPNDLLQGAIVPRVRRGYTRLPSGQFVVALGDAHIVNDPVAGQGANAATFSAHALGQTVVEDRIYDERFCQKAERRIWDHMADVSAWANFVLAPPPDHAVALLVGAAQHQALADIFVNNFALPRRAWDILSTPERTARLLAQYSVPAPAAAEARPLAALAR